MSLGHMEGTALNKSECCPDCLRINEVLSRVGDRWSLLVIISLSQYEILRFNELKRHLGISQRMLSVTLRELERDGLVKRKYYPTIPPKVEYSLSALGQSFCEPVRAVGLWALEHLPTIDKARADYDAKAVSQKA